MEREDASSVVGCGGWGGLWVLGGGKGYLSHLLRAGSR